MSTSILSDDLKPETTDIRAFVNTNRDKYESLRKIIEKNHNMNFKNIEDIDDRSPEANCVVMVRDVYPTKKGNKHLVQTEDLTGNITLLVPDYVGETIVEDEVFGVTGNPDGDIIYVDNIFRPEVTPRKTPDVDSKIMFLSDMHYGSKHFLDDVPTEVLGIAEDEEPEVILIAGDVVEGVGIYPGQEENLRVVDIFDQFKLFQDFVKQLPDESEIIIAPGNHDPVRLSEPQSSIPEKYAPDLHKMDNVSFVPNPCRVLVDGSLRVLMYHGMSFDDHVSNLQYLRENAYSQPHLAMEDWLMRRHLAPTYGSAGTVPYGEDRLVIKHTPDVLHMGHTHSFSATNYKGVNTVCSSTFQGQTDFQERVGHKPDPGKVALRLPDGEYRVYRTVSE